MGFLIGITGLGIGILGFWLDFAADPFAARPAMATIACLALGIAGIGVAITGFLLQFWSPKIRLPKFRFTAGGRYGTPNKI